MASSNLRVAIVLPKMSINGVQKVHAQLAAEFIKMDIHVDFVTSDPQGAIVSELPKKAQVIAIGQRGKQFFFPELLRYLRHTRPTHVMSAYDDVSVMVLAARSLLHLRYFALIGLHNSVVEAHRHGHGLRQLKNRLLRAAMRHFYRKADALVAVSNGLAEEFSKLARLPRDSITLVHNPVITDTFQTLLNASPSPNLPLTSDRPVIGFFGRLEPQKNVRMLLDAFALTEKTVPCQLLIVGEGSLAEDLRRRSQKLGIAKRVTFHPFVLNPLPLIRQCNVIALSSRFEGAPIVLIEAMACGVQVVATDCPHGPAEILNGGLLGQLVPVDDAKAFAAALEQSIRGTFFVQPDTLTREAMRYTARSSTAKYVELMGLGQAAPS